MFLNHAQCGATIDGKGSYDNVSVEWRHIYAHATIIQKIDAIE